MNKDKEIVSKIFSCLHDGEFISINENNKNIELKIETVFTEQYSFLKIIFYDCTKFLFEPDGVNKKITDIKKIEEVLIDIATSEVINNDLIIYVNTDPELIGSFSGKITIEYGKFAFFDNNGKMLKYLEIKKIRDVRLERIKNRKNRK